MIPKEQNIRFVKISEGFNKDIYKCPAGKWTVGYGFNIEDNPKPEFIHWQEGQELTIHVADEWLDFLIDQTVLELQTAISEFSYFEDYVQFVLIDMCYNLGITELLGFKKMLRAMADRKNGITIIEMMDSKWATQVKGRAHKLGKVIAYQDIERAFE